jgi:uncharacterized membrane protein
MSFSLHLHPASVHFPIALLSLASVAGLVYLSGRRHALLPPLIWGLMILGWIGGVVAVLTGLLAQSGLPPQAPYRNVLNWHIGSGLALLVVYGLLLYWRWLFSSTRAQKARMRTGNTAADLLDDPTGRFGFTVLLVLGLGLVIASGWNGGRLVYDWAVNVTR